MTPIPNRAMIPNHLIEHFDQILAVKRAFPGAQVVDGSTEVMDIVSTIREEAAERKRLGSATTVEASQATRGASQATVGAPLATVPPPRALFP